VFKRNIYKANSIRMEKAAKEVGLIINYNKTKFMALNYPAHSAVGIATGYWLDDRGVGVRVPVGSRIFSSPRCPDRLWGPPNLLSNGYRGPFPRGKAARL
jgi:hypothetical protein